MRWMWIDSIVHFEADARMVAVKNVSLAEDYLHDHFAADDCCRGEAMPIMPASLMIEGMAQTAGVLVGSVNQFREKVILAKIVRAEIDSDVSPGETIRYDARIDRIDAAGAATSGTIERCRHALDGQHWQQIGRVELMFSHIDRNAAGTVFPKENFVFSDNFRLVLRTAGLMHIAGESSQ